MTKMFDNDTVENGPIRSEQYLTDEAGTGHVIGREAEVHAIRDAMQPLTKRNTPTTVFVYGPPGNGKTTCVNYVFDALESETRVKTIRINCWQYRTRPALLTEILIQLGYPAPRKGKPVDERLGKLREWLDRNRSVAVALDEFDQLEDNTEILYDLHMLSQQTENNLGLVLLSNLPPDEFVLDDRSWSRLNCQMVEVEPYTADQLQDILEDRVEQAFLPGTVDPEVIEYIAEDAAESGGDCREAFARLLRVGRRASRDDAEEVTPKYLGGVDG